MFRTLVFIVFAAISRASPVPQEPEESLTISAWAPNSGVIQGELTAYANYTALGTGGVTTTAVGAVTIPVTNKFGVITGSYTVTQVFKANPTRIVASVSLPGSGNDDGEVVVQSCRISGPIGNCVELEGSGTTSPTVVASYAVEGTTSAYIVAAPTIFPVGSGTAAFPGSTSTSPASPNFLYYSGQSPFWKLVARATQYIASFFDKTVEVDDRDEYWDADEWFHQYEEAYPLRDRYVRALRYAGIIRHDEEN